MIARKYLYLVALAREQHFGRAAAACNVTVSTLSAAIRDLEGELGVTLVERGKHAATLTAEGRCVLEYAKRTLAAATELRQELAQQREGLNGRLRLGVIPSALAVVAGLSAAFTRRYPQVTLQILSLATPDILRRLRNYELDGGVVYSESGQADDLAFTPLWEEKHVLIAAHGGALDGRRSIGWREAAQLPLCLLTPDMQNRRIIDEQFARLDCTPAPRLETNSVTSMLAHVHTGAWVSILPRSVLDVTGASLNVLDLVDPALAWATGLVTLNRDPSPPMVAALRTVARSRPAGTAAAAPASGKGE